MVQIVIFSSFFSFFSLHSYGDCLLDLHLICSFAIFKTRRHHYSFSVLLCISNAEDKIANTEQSNTIDIINANYKLGMWYSLSCALRLEQNICIILCLSGFLLFMWLHKRLSSNNWLLCSVKLFIRNDIVIKMGKLLIINKENKKYVLNLT